MENIILAVIASGVLSTAITLFFTRKKTATEAELNSVNAYSTMLSDLRNQLDFVVNQLKVQQGRIEAQASQIQNLQQKEVEYLRIIGNHQKTERELRSRIKELETTLNNHLKTLN